MAPLQVSERVNPQAIPVVLLWACMLDKFLADLEASELENQWLVNGHVCGFPRCGTSRLIWSCSNPGPRMCHPETSFLQMMHMNCINPACNEFVSAKHHITGGKRQQESAHNSWQTRAFAHSFASDIHLLVILHNFRLQSPHSAKSALD